MGDLSSEVDNNILKEAFEKFGEISLVYFALKKINCNKNFRESKVMRDPQSMKSRGFGFVSYPKKEVKNFFNYYSIIILNLSQLKRYTFAR